jgi:hypothetical protein
MPLRKYRSVEDMPHAALRERGDPANLRIACELSATAIRFAPRRFPAGVHKYRSIALAHERRESWERSTDPRRASR